MTASAEIRTFLDEWQIPGSTASPPADDDGDDNDGGTAETKDENANGTDRKEGGGPNYERCWAERQQVMTVRLCVCGWWHFGMPNARCQCQMSNVNTKVVGSCA